MENQNMEKVELQQAEESVMQQDPEQQQEKLFTQEQVNEIIKRRLSRQNAEKPTAEELSAREEKISAREKRLDCKEYLNDKDYPTDLLDILDTSDVEAFKEKADKAYALFGEKNTAPPLASTEMYSGVHNTVNPFTTPQKHKPRSYPPRYSD